MAISFYERKSKNSFIEELKFLRQIDPGSENVYGSLLDNDETGNDGPAPEKDPSVENPAAAVSIENKSIEAKLSRARECYSKSKLQEAVSELHEVLLIESRNNEAKQMLRDIDNEKYVSDPSKPFQEIIKQLFEEALVMYRRGNYKTVFTLSFIEGYGHFDMFFYLK